MILYSFCKTYKKRLSLIITLTLISLWIPENNVNAANVDHVIINQFFGVGNSSCSSHSFIELYNPTNEAVDLTNYSIHYVPALAVSDAEAWSDFVLSGNIPAKGSYLIRCNAVVSADSPKVDLTGADSYDIDWPGVTIYSTGGSVCLLNSDVELGNQYSDLESRDDYVDLLAAAGNKATDGEGPRVYETSYSKITTKKKGIRRVDFIDTDNNAEDVIAVDYDANDVSSYRPRSSNDGSWGDPKLLLIKEINTLKSQIPMYYREYCSGDSVSAIDALLESFPSNLNSLDITELTSIRDTLSSTLGSLQYKYKDDVVQLYLTTDKGNGSSYGTTLTKADGYVSCRIAGVSADGSTLFDDLNGKVKIRGNYTSHGEKKPYNIKFSEKQNLFGFGKAKTWCLLADYYDKTLLKNQLALDLAKEIGLAYTAEHQRVDVHMDGEYQGSYLLTEKIEADKNRVDVKTGENDTDFIIEMESKKRVEPENVYFTTSKDYFFRLREPDEDKEYAETRAVSVKEYMDNFESTLVAGNWDDLSAVIDVESFAKYYVLNEYLRPSDFPSLSVYFYCKEGVLYAGPAWDYDFSSGDVASSQTLPIASRSHYYMELLRYSEFRDVVRQTFVDNVAALHDLFSDNGWIDTQYATYTGTINRNNNKWGIDQCQYEAYIESLKEWFSDRFTWLNGYTQGDFAYIPPTNLGGGGGGVPAPAIPAMEIADNLSDDGIASSNASADSSATSADASGEPTFASMDASKDALDASSDASGDPVTASENATASSDGDFVEPSGDAVLPSSDATFVKLPNTLKLKVYKKVYKRTKDLKKKRMYAIRVTNNKGAVKYTLSNKAKKARIAVSKKGIISIPKKCKKGIYSITVHASGNKKYLPGTKTFVLKVK